MSYIPETYLLKDGAEVPEGSKKLICKLCKREFAVPADGSDLMLEEICESCKENYEKQEAANKEAEAKAGTTADTQNEIDKALGK